MSIDPKIKLGTYTQCIADGARWLGQDDFPSNQSWADEIEKVLAHVAAQDQFERFLPRLRDQTARHRDSAIAEARVSFFFFKRNSFRIVSWDPEGDKSSVGEMEIQWDDTPKIFVEVKNPNWEGELSPTERLSGRKKRPKYITGETRSHDSIERVLFAIEKSREKFSNDRPNLSAVVPDTFVSLLTDFGLRDFREGDKKRIESFLAEPANDVIGGVFLFEAFKEAGHDVDYQTFFIGNESAKGNCRLPSPVVEDLIASNSTKFH